MDANQVLKTEFEMIGRQLREVLKDLSPEQILHMPGGNNNSIGFLAWHILLAWDEYDTLIQKQDDLYRKDGWPEKFGFDVSGRGIEGSGMGTGFTPEDVALVRPQVETLLAYHAAVSRRTLDYIKNASQDELATQMVIPWWPNPVPVARVLIHIIGHSLIHIGEAWATKDLALQESAA
jgi:uncharacterized damage-inducible protein DinB